MTYDIRVSFDAKTNSIAFNIVLPPKVEAEIERKMSEYKSMEGIDYAYYSLCNEAKSGIYSKLNEYMLTFSATKQLKISGDNRHHVISMALRRLNSEDQVIEMIENLSNFYLIKPVGRFLLDVLIGFINSKIQPEFNFIMAPDFNEAISEAFNPSLDYSDSGLK